MFIHLGSDTRFRSLLLFTLSLLLATAALAQKYPDTGEAGTGGNNTILGNVFLPTGQRVDRPIRVRLFTPTRGDMTTMTTSDGSFSFRRLATGSYTVVIDGERDFEAVSQSVYIVQATRSGPPGVYNADFRLKLKSSSEVKPAVVNSELANVPRRALDLYNKALELAKGGNSKGAIEQLKQAVSEYPDFMLAFNEMGVQYLRLGDVKNAEESLRSALKIKPDGFEPLMNHGIALVRLNRFEEAEPELRAAVTQKDQSAVGHFYLGRALAYLQRYDEGEKELNLAVQLGGDEMKEAHRYLAAIYNTRGDKKRAISELETYLKLAPNSKDADHLRQLIRDLGGSK
jgi:Tfp pilus assembly protein PilF